MTGNEPNGTETHRDLWVKAHRASYVQISLGSDGSGHHESAVGGDRGQRFPGTGDESLQEHVS
ncbi:hypothetical protein [Arthrobacter sp. KK5.5]|uniref:hypothetical protein n=1 Tax=Arthrobacter sp. KK5.5 TaxID=3373084 RepID=UPI003EE6FE78